MFDYFSYLLVIVYLGLTSCSPNNSASPEPATTAEKIEETAPPQVVPRRPDETVDCVAQAQVMHFLSHDQIDKAKDALSRAIENIEKKALGNGIEKFYSATRTVFTIAGLPQLIFKKAITSDEAEENSRKAQFATCEAKRWALHQLIVPKIESLKVVKQDKEYYFTVEQMLDLKVNGGSFDAHEAELYKELLAAQSDRNELSKFEELFNQLAIFAAETDFSDFKYDNLPLLRVPASDKPQIGIVDIESIGIGQNTLKKDPRIQIIIKNPVLPSIFFDSVIKTLQNHLGIKVLWPNFENGIIQVKASQKQKMDYSAYLQNKDFTYDKMFSLPENLKKASPLLQCQIKANLFFGTERQIAEHINSLLDYAINWSDQAPQNQNSESLLLVRQFELALGGALPAFNTKADASEKQKKFEKANAQFIKQILNVSEPKMPEDGWQKDYCKAVTPILLKAKQHGDIFSDQCSMKNGFLMFRIQC